MTDWDKQLASGEGAEDAFVSLLRRLSPIPMSDVDIQPSHGKQSEWDVTATFGDKDVRFEVKNDLRSSETGNIAIEWGNINNGEFRETGLLVTTSDWWIHRVYRSGLGWVFYASRIDTLRTLLLWNINGKLRPSPIAEKDGIYHKRKTTLQTTDKGNLPTWLMLVSMDYINTREDIWFRLDKIRDGMWYDLLKDPM